MSCPVQRNSKGATSAWNGLTGRVSHVQVCKHVYAVRAEQCCPVEHEHAHGYSNFSNLLDHILVHSSYCQARVGGCRT